MSCLHSKYLNSEKNKKQIPKNSHPAIENMKKKDKQFKQ